MGKPFRVLDNMSLNRIVMLGILDLTAGWYLCF